MWLHSTIGPLQNWYANHFFLLIYKSCINETFEKHPSDLKRNKLYNGSSHEILNCFLKNHWKRSLKYLKLEKKKKQTERKKLRKWKKVKRRKTKNTIKSKYDLKEPFQTNRFSHLIVKARFHIFFRRQKMYNSVVSNSFQ